MNTSIETLNHWGGNFLGFVWPMLWQSSLLIVIVFALDFLLARKVRAAIRHVLWMVVLVKLLLPPALALPTGLAWWVWPAKPSFTPVIKNESVSFDNSIRLDNFVPQQISAPVPPPKFSGPGYALLASGMVGAGLFFSLVFQWLKVERKSRRAPAFADFSSDLEAARKLAGLRGSIRLRLVDDAISPAVYGLFRPVILLPRALAEKLSGSQLRAVLLHEAIHLRRGDVWVNCAQTLLQIFYWWHPLLWMANARIRRLREEAVDDAVMAALHGEADVYAPTLLEVAKFAFRRPLASLGLVGILESRSALRQRVERLVDFRPPRKTGVTFLALCGIFLFGAVALPMGQAPAAESDSNTGTMLPQPTVDAPINTPSALTPAGVTNRVETQEFNPGANTFNVSPPIPSGTVTLTGALKNTGDTAAGRKEIYGKLIKIRMDKVSFESLPLDQVIQQLNEISLRRDRDHKGVNFLFSTNADNGPLPRINPATGLPEQPVKSQPVDDTQIIITLKVNNVTLLELLDAICLVSDHPIKYSLEDDGVVFSQKAPGSPYEMRTFKVNTNTVLQNLHRQIDSPMTISEALKEVFLKAGVNLSPPKTVFYNDGLGEIFVYATPQDLDVIESAVQELGDPRSAFMDVTTSSSASDRKQASDAWGQVGKEFYESGNLDEAGRDLDEALDLNPDNKAARYYQSLIQQIRTNAKTGGRVLVNSGGGHIPDEIKKIHLDTFGPFDKDPLIGVVQELNRRAAKAGADFKIAFVSPTPSTYDDASILVTMPKLNNLSLAEAFDLVAECASEPAQYMIMDNLVAFAPDPRVAAVSLNTGPRFDVEHYQVMGNTVLSQQTIDKVLASVDGAYGTNVSFGKVRTVVQELQSAYLDRGYRKVVVDLPQQRLTNATVKIEVNEDAPPQVHIKARFIEMPSSGPNISGGTGILTATQFRTALHLLQSQKGVQEIAEPECTTLSGRQCEMRATEERQVVFGYTLQPSGKPHVPAVVPQELTNVEVGPICDVMPVVMADGYSIDLKAIGNLIDFFGYADPNGLKGVTTNYDGIEIKLPVVLPAFLVSSTTSQAVLYDGQTLVMFPKAEQNPKADEFSYQPDEKSRERIAEHIQKAQKKKGDKTLVLFVTITLIDAAGNRFHSDEEMAFAKNSVPRQPQILPDTGPVFPGAMHTTP